MRKKILFEMNIFEILSFIFSLLYYLTPILFLFNLYRKLINKKYVSYFSLGSLYLNGLLYFTFCLSTRKNPNYSIITLELCNLIGALLCFIFSLIYINLVYKDKKKFELIILFIFSSLILILLEYVLINFCVNNNHSNLKNIFFYSINVFNILMYLPSGFNIIKIIKDKIPEKIILISSIIGLLNCISWIIFAIDNIVIDNGNSVHIIISNSFSALICINQIILFFYFLRQFDNKNDEINDPLNLNENNDEINSDDSDDKIPKIFETII